MENASFLLIYILLPLAGIVALIFLCVVLYNLIFTIKKINPIIEDVNYKLNILNIPVEAIVKVNNSWTRFTTKITRMFLRK